MLWTRQKKRVRVIICGSFKKRKARKPVSTGDGLGAGKRKPLHTCTAHTCNTDIMSERIGATTHLDLFHQPHSFFN